MKRPVSLFIFSVLLWFPYSYSQETFDFLRIDMSARAASLGGSFVANNDDIDVIFYNPAGIGMLTGNPASFSFVRYLVGGINLASVAYSQEVGTLGRFGAAIQYINYGTFTAADENGNVTGQFNAGEIAFLIGYSNTLSDNFYYGANGKVIYSSIAGISASALALDLGLHYTIPTEGIDLGFSILNAGTEMTSYFTTKESLPLDVAVGVSKKMEHIPIKLYLDFHQLNESQDQFGDRFKDFSVGSEITMSKVMTLRLGFNNKIRTDWKIGSYAGIAGFNIGLGVLVSDYHFDYGFSSLGQAGGLHRISISTNF